MPVIREIDIKFKFKEIDCDITGQELDSPNKVARTFDFLKYETKERFIVVNLTAQNRINTYEVVAIGSATSINIRPSEVLRSAVITNMPTVMLVHNHPSGITKPSSADIRFTQQVINAASLFDIQVLDHIIIGLDEFTSIKNENEIMFLRQVTI